jgi:hypothetical protein
MVHSDHSAGESLTSTIFRSLDSMFSLSHYVCSSFTTTLIKDGSIVGGIYELFTWLLCTVNAGFIIQFTRVFFKWCHIRFNAIHTTHIA